jgi:hypothetical protein
MVENWTLVNDLQNGEFDFANFLNKIAQLPDGAELPESIERPAPSLQVFHAGLELLSMIATHKNRPELVKMVPFDTILSVINDASNPRTTRAHYTKLMVLLYIGEGGIASDIHTWSWPRCRTKATAEAARGQGEAAEPDDAKRLARRKSVSDDPKKLARRKSVSGHKLERTTSFLSVETGSGPTGHVALLQKCCVPLLAELVALAGTMSRHAELATAVGRGTATPAQSRRLRELEAETVDVGDFFFFGTQMLNMVRLLLPVLELADRRAVLAGMHALVDALCQMKAEAGQTDECRDYFSAITRCWIVTLEVEVAKELVSEVITACYDRKGLEAGRLFRMLDGSREHYRAQRPVEFGSLPAFLDPDFHGPFSVITRTVYSETT